jgi:Ring finger domain
MIECGTPNRPIFHAGVVINDVDLTGGTPSRSLTTARRRGVSSPVNGTATASTIDPTDPFRKRAEGRRPFDIMEEGEDESKGLKASLDAGMARVRRWIRSRPPSSPRALSVNYDMNSSHSIRTLFPPGDVDSQDSASNDEDDGGDDIFDLPLRSESSAMDRDRTPRQRALSEPDGDQIRDLLYQRAVRARAVRRRNIVPVAHSFTSDTHGLEIVSRPRGRGDSIELDLSIAFEHASSGQGGGLISAQAPNNHHEDMITNNIHAYEGTAGENSMETDAGTLDISRLPSDPDPMRDARNRWITINRRFQYVITVVALIFSLLLFAILLCWVVLTSSFVISIDKVCDVPLKVYYWCVTLQLILDVFRTDIMRFFFRWDASSNHRIPCRVITYNAAYLIYALLVLRMGARSVFLNEDTTTCQITAPELFQSTTIFVCLSVAAWTTIVFGYLMPFLVVATLLTLNGYTPTSDATRDGAGAGPFTVFPSVMGAPPHCIDEMPIIVLEDFPIQYPMECCICMEKFIGTDVIVETGCHHVFHKNCCRDWLRQARTCPVCRTDIPLSLGIIDGNSDAGGRHLRVSSRFGQRGSAFVNRNDIHHEVVSLLQILRRYERHQQSELGQSSTGETTEYW